MKTHYLTGFLGMALVAAACFAGCSPSEQHDAAQTAEKTLDKAGNVATKALDKGADITSNVSITGAVKARYASTKGVPATTIDVTTQNNVVTLTGSVRNESQRKLAVQIANTTTGVHKVIDKLKVVK